MCVVWRVPVVLCVVSAARSSIVVKRRDCRESFSTDERAVLNEMFGYGYGAVPTESIPSVRQNRIPPEGLSRLGSRIKEHTKMLEKQRDMLRREVQTLERELKKATQQNFNTSDNSNILTQCKLNGYFLTGCKTKDLGNNQKQYTASCEDARHPFRFTVITKDDDVTSVNVALPATSPLNEIRSDLDTLSEDNCPFLVLSSIQQFIHLHHFRNRIIQEKLQQPIGGRTCFTVYHPEFQEKGNHHYIIKALYGSIEIAWTLVWDKVDCTLVHGLTILKLPPNDNLKNSQSKLLDQTFSARNASILWDWWTEFCSIVATLF